MGTKESVHNLWRSVVHTKGDGQSLRRTSGKKSAAPRSQEGAHLGTVRVRSAVRQMRVDRCSEELCATGAHQVIQEEDGRRVDGHQSR